MLRVRFGPIRSPEVRPCREAVARTMRPTDRRSEAALSPHTAGDGHGTWSTRPAASRDASGRSSPVEPGGLVSDTQTVTPAAARASRRPVTACWVSDPPIRSMPRTITRCIPDNERRRRVAAPSSPARRAVPSSRPSSSTARRGWESLQASRRSSSSRERSASQTITSGHPGPTHETMVGSMMAENAALTRGQPGWQACRALEPACWEGTIGEPVRTAPARRKPLSGIPATSTRTEAGYCVSMDR